jgi:DNA-binding MarR family transcriptional regulator
MATRRASPAVPDPVAEPLHRGALHLLRLLRREDDASGLSPARLSALSVLVFGGRTTLGALATAEGVSAPTMSRLVTGLERDGWLIRRIDPDDARSAWLEASAAARALLLDGRARRLEALTSGLRALTVAERRALAGALPALERLVRQLALKPRRASSGLGRRRFD